VVSAPGRITPPRAPPYEELNLRHEFAHLFSGKSTKLLLPELHSLTPLGELTVLPRPLSRRREGKGEGQGRRCKERSKSIFKNVNKRKMTWQK